MTGWLGISLGDATGIGPEVALKAVAAEAGADDTKYLLIGDEKILLRLNEKFSLNLPLQKFPEKNSGRFFYVNPFAEKIPAKISAGSAVAAKAAMACLHDGAERCLRGELDALVTAPVNKEAIIRAGHKNFVGQTEFLSELAGAKRTAMMLLGTDAAGRWLRVALATIHISIKSVPKRLTAEKISLAIDLAAQACRDLQLPRAKIAVAGLNPHAPSCRRSRSVDMDNCRSGWKILRTPIRIIVTQPTWLRYILRTRFPRVPLQHWRMQQK